MMKNLYATVDTLGGFVLYLELSSMDPELYVAEKNRAFLAKPNEFGSTSEFRHLGKLDDETLQGELFAIAPVIGNLKAAVKKLEDYVNARKAEAAANGK